MRLAGLELVKRAERERKAVQGGDVLLTDDLEAREAAQSFGVEVHGSVGFIVRAFRLKALSRKEAMR